MRRSPSGVAIYSLFLLFASVLLTEIALRVYFAHEVGPRVLLYGTPWHHNRAAFDAPLTAEHRKIQERTEEASTRLHTNYNDGYTKYFPNELKFDVDLETEERFEVRVNSRGFRGPDFTEARPANVHRVVTLGASSTFGYYNRDETTYPAILEEILNGQCGGESPFEVINLAIPHLTADQIANLFFAEGAALAPDVLTFYEGNNDAARDDHEVWAYTEMTWLDRVKAHSLAAAFVANLATVDRVAPDLIELRRDAAARSRDFLAAVGRILDYSREKGALLIVANQQKRSLLIDRSEIAGITYAEEREIVRRKLVEEGRLTVKEHRFLLHGYLMDDLERWARERGVPFVDVIGLLDDHRDVLVSAVHLSPEGNRAIAEAFARKIRELLPCPGDGA